MTVERVLITEPDLWALAAILEAESRWPGMEDRQGVHALRAKLARAEVVPEHQIPSDVITLQSRIRLEDLDTGGDSSYRLVKPAEASAAAARISVLSPLGAALMGRRPGDQLEQRLLGGQRTLRIDRLLFQPEAARRRAA